MSTHDRSMLRAELAAARRVGDRCARVAADGEAPCPAGCTSTWDGGAGSDVWENPVRLERQRAPRFLFGGLVPTFFTVTIASTVSVSRASPRRYLVVSRPASGLFVTGATSSVWDSNTFVFADRPPRGPEPHRAARRARPDRRLGADVDRRAQRRDVRRSPGSLVVMAAPSDFVDAVSVRTRYELHVFGTGQVESDSLVSADWGMAIDLPAALRAHRRRWLLPGVACRRPADHRHRQPRHAGQDRRRQHLGRRRQLRPRRQRSRRGRLLRHPRDRGPAADIRGAPAGPVTGHGGAAACRRPPSAAAARTRPSTR